MKDKNVIKKASFLLRILLMFCWHVGKSTRPEPSTMENPNGSGHQLLNKALYNTLGSSAKTKLAPYKEIIFQSADPELGRKNPDEVDGPLIEQGEDRSHSDISYCEWKANHHTTRAAELLNTDPRRAAYDLAYGFHYIQDMACPVHMGKLGGTNTNKYCKEYSNGSKKCPDSNGNMIQCTSGQLHGAYERPKTSNVYCNSYSGCEEYQAVIDAYNDSENGMSKKLTNLVGSMKGFNVLKDVGVQEYLIHRAKLWIQYYCTDENVEAKNRLIYDYAMAVGIQKRYLYRSGLEVFRQ